MTRGLQLKINKAGTMKHVPQHLNCTSMRMDSASYSEFICEQKIMHLLVIKLIE